MDRFEISCLRSYYGALLTERQNDMLRMRYDEDLSLGEIAELLGVSRQAALDGIVKGEKRLAEIDEKLKFVDRDEKVKKLAQELLLSPMDEGAHAAVKEILRLLEE